MRNGAIALIDALGFRGIWEHHRRKPDDVMATLTEIRASMEKRVSLLSTQRWMECEIIFFSDTIVISMALDDSTKNREAMSVVYLCDVVGQILYTALHSKVPLAYRGAVTIGEYDISPPFVIGQAIDEAAGAYERAQCAVVWLTPRARDRVADWLRGQPKNTHLVRFDVPLKGGDKLSTYTVSCLEQARGQDDADNVTQNLMELLSSPNVGVAIKRRNTERHMRACYKWRNLRFPEGLCDF